MVGVMIQTDNDEYDRKVGENVRDAIEAKGLSVNGAAKESGIAYATLDRKLKGLSSFNTRELRALSRITGRKVRTFLPAEGRAADRPADTVLKGAA